MQTQESVFEDTVVACGLQEETAGSASGTPWMKLSKAVLELDCRRLMPAFTGKLNGVIPLQNGIARSRANGIAQPRRSVDEKSALRVVPGYITEEVVVAGVENTEAVLRKTID